MGSITQTIPSFIGGISQQPDELKKPGQLVEAQNVIPDVTQGLIKRPGSKFIASLSDNGTAALNSSATGRWFHYYRDETEQYIGQINRSGDVNIWRCSDGQAMTVETEGIREVTVDTGGSGYTKAPIVTITNSSGSTGSGATATAVLTGDAVTTIKVTAPGKLYSAGATATISIPAWQANTAYAINDQVTNDSGKVYTCDQAGTSAGSGGPTGTGADITDNGARWDHTTVVAATATVEVYQGTASTLASYLTHTDDEHIQTLTLNDFTYITNRLKATGMSGRKSPTRAPEAFVELKKVAYADQYSLNIYDKNIVKSDGTLDTTDVHTATRIKVEREIDSSNSCGSNGAFPPSQTLPGTGSYNGRCVGSSAGDTADGYCPNVATEIHAFNPGEPTDPDNANGVTGHFTFWRDGVEQSLYEVQKATVTVLDNKSYTFTAHDGTNTHSITVNSGSGASLPSIVSAIQADNTYQANGYPVHLSSEQFENSQVEIQKVRVDGQWGWGWGANTERCVTVNGTTICMRGSGHMTYVNQWVTTWQSSSSYSNLDATISLEDIDGSSDKNIVFTFKVPGTQPSNAYIGNPGLSGSDEASVTTASVLATGDLKVIHKTSGAKNNSTFVNNTDGGTVTFAETTSVTSGIADDINPKNLYFRITTIGQAVPEGDDADPEYHCRYTTTHDLLYGGEGWLKDDYFYVWMKNAKYKVTIKESVKATVQANLALIRPTPTSFDTKQVVTSESILGAVRTQIVASNSGNNFSDATTQQIGSGLYLTRPLEDIGSSQTYGTFNVDTSAHHLWNIVTSEVQDVSDLPMQCKHGFVTKVQNSDSDKDDYYVQFNGENERDGPGVWRECAEPGRQIEIDAGKMPVQLVREVNNTFQLSEVIWKDCNVGDNTLVPKPSFISTVAGDDDDTVTKDRFINKLLFFRNRLVILSGENVIMSQPGDFFNFWPKSAITFSPLDNIDLSCSSDSPATVYDGIQVNAGLVLFTKNQQFMLTTDSDVLSPETAKINALSTYNFNEKSNPISLGTTIGFLDNAGKYTRFWEMTGAAREGDPNVLEQSKVVSTLLDSDIELVSNSRENSIVFFSKTGSSTLYGWRYLTASRERLQQAWFTWEFTGTIRHHCILDDSLYIVIRNNNKDTLRRIPIRVDTDTATVTDDMDTADTSDDITYSLHLDNYSTISIASGTYNSSTNKTTFAKPTAGYEDVGQMAVYDNSAGSGNTDPIGKYATATVNGSNLEIVGDWSNNSVVLGYLYDMKVKFPTLYVTSTSEDRTRSDTSASLVVHRVKFNFGPAGLYKTTLDRVNKTTYTETFEPIIADQTAANQIAINNEITQTIPTYEKNTNLSITLESTHPAPATLYSMTWEGDYNPKYYQRV